MHDIARSFQYCMIIVTKLARQSSKSYLVVEIGFSQYSIHHPPLITGGAQCVWWTRTSTGDEHFFTEMKYFVEMNYGLKDLSFGHLR